MTAYKARLVASQSGSHRIVRCLKFNMKKKKEIIEKKRILMNK